MNPFLFIRHLQKLFCITESGNKNKNVLLVIKNTNDSFYRDCIMAATISFPGFQDPLESYEFSMNTLAVFQ